MKSIRGCKYRWKLPVPIDSQQLDELSRSCSLVRPLVELLIRRGVGTAEAVNNLLFPVRERVVADPALLKGGEVAVERMLRAIKQQEKILIVGDYDVDGMTGTALFVHALQQAGAQVHFFLPHRVRDGYGLSAKTIDRAVTSGYQLLITVDNGITSFEAATRARELGIDLIITDHHQPHGQIPDALIIVNPWQSGCAYPYKHLAGVGVAFKLVSLLYQKLERPLPKLLYELLALGTVADVMPLTGENRFWVQQGLVQMNGAASLAIDVLRQNARLVRRITALDLGFFLAPQLNALGRLDDPRASVSFLLSEDVGEVERVGKVLYDLNQDRRAIEAAVIADVERDIASGAIDLSREKVIVSSSTRWPVGVIGLAASRITSQYNRPTLLFHETDEGVLKGSGRSIPAFNLFEALSANKDLLLRFGGHAVAAGLSMQSEQLGTLKARLEQMIAAQLTDADFEQQLVCDAEITARDATKKFLTDLSLLEPFGAGNERPLFYLKNVSILDKPVLYKDAHVRCKVFSDGIIKPVIFFNRPDLFEPLLRAEDGVVDCAVHLSENVWDGQTKVEFQGIDIAFH